MTRIIIALMLFVVSIASAQNKDKKDNSSPIKFSGGLSLSSNLYSNGGVGEQRQSPYSYSITGSPTLTIYKVSLPFSFTYSDQKFSYGNAFNTYGISPRYKWARLHLGYRSMNFSSYTLGGRQFLGAGIDLTPGKFHFSALYGRLDNFFAIKHNLRIGASSIDTYKRNIYGFKIGAGRTTGFDFVFLKVKDDIKSSVPKQGDNTKLLPQDNIVIGLNFKTTLIQRISIKVESAASLHTRDSRTNIEIDTSDNYYKLFSIASKIIKPNISTRWGFAGKAEANLHLNTFDIGLSYQRVEPNFKSLGVYYMITDFENYTANIGFKFLKNKLSFKLKGGFQKNNLSLLRRATSLRKIGSARINYSNSKGFNINFNYNNIQSDQRAGYVELEDSLRLILSNSTTSLNTGYNWKKKDIKHSININLSSSSFANINEEYFTPLGETKNNNINLSYSLRHKPSQMNYSLSTNYYTLKSEQTKNSGFGINIGIGKMLLDKKLSLRLNTSANKRFVEGNNDGIHFRLRTRIKYKITKKQGLSFYISWSKRPSISKRPLNETRASLSYNLNF
jgi:hypothetical protein